MKKPPAGIDQPVGGYRYLLIQQQKNFAEAPHIPPSF
jgi:hypothetical protein